MKVSELIEELSNFNGNLEVRIFDRRSDFGYCIDEPLDILDFNGITCVALPFPSLNS